MRLGTLVALIVFAGNALADSVPAVPAAGITLAPAITTGDSPANHVVAPPGSFDGVASLVLSYAGVAGQAGCSGSLLSGGTYILTAGHCVTGPGGEALASAQVTFNLAGGPMTLFADAAFTPPTWDGNLLDGSDIALLRLPSPVGIAGYDLYRAEASGTVELAGYGYSGTGATGYTPGTFGTLHRGSNSYEVLWIDNRGQNSWYGFDFDSGLAANDAFGVEFGLTDLGLGLTLEADIAPGDSGGPTFFGGRLAGVHSWTGRFPAAPPDVDGVLNSSWGEVAADTRVDLYAGWVDSIVNPVPEPGTIGMAVTVAMALLAFRKGARS